MISTLFQILLTTWLLWVGWNVAVMLLSAVFYRSNYASFNGFVIVIPKWMMDQLSTQELQAIISHEEGHRAQLHVWENLLRSCLLMPTKYERRMEQELEADDHAIAAGHAEGLASALMQLSRDPFVLSRVNRIQRA